MVGQRFVTLLENHPYFDVRVLAASVPARKLMQWQPTESGN